MNKTIDVLGLGCVAVDDLLTVGEYPPADAKVPILRADRQCGGLAATALVTAARLGVRAAYAATLGDDEGSRFVLDRLVEQGVDVRWVRRRPEVRTIHAVIVVEQARRTRTIFYSLDGAVGAEPDWPPDEVIRSARALFVDHFGVEGMLRAAAIARAAGIPLVADFEGRDHPRFPELLQEIDHLILSRHFAGLVTGESDPAAAVRALWSERRQAVVVTCGEQGAWFAGPEQAGRPRHQPAFPVRVVDTTGCGDVFHGAYVAALVEGLTLADRVRFAAATAALKATQSGGQAGIPNRPAVEALCASTISSSSPCPSDVWPREFVR